MFRRINRSQVLSRLIERLSTFLAKRRGLPVVVGILLVIVSFVLQIVSVYSDTRAVDLFAVITLNVGILLALIGLLLADPLGN